MQDVVFLVADADMDQALQGLLSKRTQSLGIREISFQIYRHNQRDPGCCHEAAAFLRPFAKQFRYAVVLFDHQGSGKEGDKADELVMSWKNKSKTI